jgi:protein-S-isoprenylcysteine O-methyltransferase Ste14
MRATRFEFEYRFWIICAIYFVAFALSIFDHTPFIIALRQLIAPGSASHTPEAATFARVVIAIGAALVFVSAALRAWAAAYLQTAIVHDTSQHSEALVADGPFRHTRNPLYLGNIPMAAGIGVLASRSGFIFLVIANWIFVYRLIFREEEALLRTQGESYRVYLNAVPRFWLSLKPRIAASGRARRDGNRRSPAKVLSGYSASPNC